MKQLAIQCAIEAGRLLLTHFGNVHQVSRKESRSSIVTAADLASERLIHELIVAEHPDHNFLGEETGFEHRGSEFTWVVDPLDGTSNFAAGIPWFGVLVAMLHGNRPVLAAVHLPASGELFVSEAGQGVFRDGQRIQFPTDQALSDVLCAYGMDAEADLAANRRQVDLLARLANRARNVRFTNSLVDFCYTLDGRFGAWINHACKIWDIASACLMFREAGGRFTDLAGTDISLSLDAAACARNYAVLGASPALHEEVLEIVKMAR